MKRIMYIDVELCPVCGTLNKDFLLDGNYFYLCHCCGQFFRSFSDGREPIVGILHMEEDNILLVDIVLYHKRIGLLLKNQMMKLLLLIVIYYA